MTVPQAIVFYIREITVTLLCAAASIFAIVGTFGMFKFKDPYVRLQASALAGTPAVFSVLIAALCYSFISTAPALAVGARIIVIMLFYMVSCPTTTHIIARYAWRSGIESGAKDKT